MKEKGNNKKILLIIVGILLVVNFGVICIMLFLNGSSLSEGVEYVKRVVYNQKLEDLGNPSKDIGIMLLDCDSVEDFKDIQNVKVTTRTGKYVQGTGAFANMKFQSNLLFGTMKEAIDISEYEKGSIHISLYVEDKTCLTDGINFELASNGVCDSDELQWIIPLSKIEEGWNEYYLSIPGAMRSGKPDLTNINFFRAYSVEPTMGVTVILDNVYATETEGVAYEPDPVPLRAIVPDGYKETQTEHGKMIMSCNTVNVFSAMEYAEVTTKKGEYIEGTGALKTVGVQNLLLAGVFAKPIDLTEYKEGSVHVSLYVNDVSLLTQEIFFELTSCGTWDADEYNWTITRDQLKNGWNELYLPFSNAMVTGSPDLKKIDFVRFFTIGQKEGLITIFDNVYATNKGPTDSAKETTSPYGEMIMSCNTVNIFRWLNYVEVTSTQNEYVEGTGALKTIGHQNLLLEGLFEETRNIAAYKNGYIHVSLYINDTSLLKDDIFLELTSSGTWDADEYNWAITRDQLKNGWNELYLPFGQAVKTGSPNLKAINFVRFFTTGQKKGLVTIFDNVYATNNASSAGSGGTGNTTTEETNSPYGKMIASCNTTDIFTTLNFVEKTSKAGEYIEGTGAFKTVGKENLLIEAVLANAINISKYKDGFVHVAFYVNDKSCFTQEIFFELTSSGVCDVDEYNWSITVDVLQNGWNEIYLPFSNAAVTGSPDLKKINFFRAFSLNRKDGAVIIFDNIYATNSKYNETEIVCEETVKQGDVMLSNCLCYYKNYSNFKLTTSCKEGAFALKINNPANAMFGTFVKPVNVSAYKNGYIHVWLYVNNADYLTKDVNFELSSSGESNKNEYEWVIPKKNLSSGWNEIWLSFADAKVAGSPDLASINYFRLYTNDSNSKLSIIVDDVRATNTK